MIGASWLRTSHRLRIALAALLLPIAALAGTMGPAVTDQPLPWNGDTIKLGDAEARVRKIADGYPQKIEPLLVGGRKIGERWMYVGNKDNPNVLWVEFTRGRVTRMWTELIDESGKLGSAPKNSER